MSMRLAIYLLIALSTLLLALILAMRALLEQEWWYLGAAFILLIPCAASVALANAVKDRGG